ncbi:hypothetical protein [Aeromonas enteropelogenes]|uniref:hypothetical protein n=1 Tax=Aeromonas enteropelogenes TaxID=29489 RepID=UPI003B9FC14A
MKKGVVIILSFIFSLSAYADVSGLWECDTCGNMSIKLTLDEKDRHVIGNYCLISNNGNRIDCDGNSISGEISKNTIKIKFVNSWGDVGKASLTTNQDGFIWKTDDGTPFLRASMAIPASFTLKRVKDDSGLHARVLKKCAIKNDMNVIDGFVSKGQSVMILGASDDGAQFKIEIVNKNLVGWVSDECLDIE